MRVFVAIELADEVKRAVQKLIAGLGAFDRMVRWVRPEQMHLTLKFLGDVPDGQVPAVCQAAEGVAGGVRAFDWVLDTSGGFPPQGKVRIAWVGSRQAPATLPACQEQCEAAYERLGFAREVRPYTPHITIGRVRTDQSGGRLRRALEQAAFPAVSQTVSGLTVFQSVLSPQGARYTALGCFTFSGAG